MAVAHFFKEMRGVRLSQSTTDDDMHMMNFFVILPKGSRCEVELPQERIWA